MLGAPPADEAAVPARPPRSSESALLAPHRVSEVEGGRLGRQVLRAESGEGRGAREPVRECGVGWPPGLSPSGRKGRRRALQPLARSPPPLGCRHLGAGSCQVAFPPFPARATLSSPARGKCWEGRVSCVGRGRSGDELSGRDEGGGGRRSSGTRSRWKWRPARPGLPQRPPSSVASKGLPGLAGRLVTADADSRDETGGAGGKAKPMATRALHWQMQDKGGHGGPL